MSGKRCRAEERARRCRAGDARQTPSFVYKYPAPSLPPYSPSEAPGRFSPSKPMPSRNFRSFVGKALKCHPSGMLTSPTLMGKKSDEVAIWAAYA
ncbi:hypothetical protein Dimus_027525 [Dionaea muscipula]